MKRDIRPLDPIDLMIHRNWWARFWLCCFIVTIVTALAYGYVMAGQLTKRQSFVIMDPAGTYYVAESTDFEDAQTLHVAQSTLAMESLLDRNPNGTDHPKRLELLFSKEAWRKASKLIKNESDEFQHKELHQKVEIGSVEILRIRDRSVLTHVKGQLIRVGKFADNPISEVLEVNARFKFVLNPDMIHNGRFPSVVVDFDYETSLGDEA